MSVRFKYEAPNAFFRAALYLTIPRRWRAKARPWIVDNLTGVRFQPSEDEEALLRRLSGPTDTAFERVVVAIMDKRRGYVSDWNRFCRGLPSAE